MRHRLTLIILLLAVCNVFEYDAYGTLIASNAVSQTDYLFAGEQFDAHVGFYYLRARYLNTDTSRFWTMDSFEGVETDPLSLHKYLYVHADPVTGLIPAERVQTRCRSISVPA